MVYIKHRNVGGVHLQFYVSGEVVSLVDKIY